MVPGDRPDEGLAERIRDVLLERPDVVFAYLFGSSAGGSRRSSSDVDVAVYLEERASDDHDRATEGETGEAARSLGQWAQIHGDIVRSVGGGRDRGGAPEGVDLVLLNRAPPLLSDRVARSGDLLLSRNEAERVAWLVRTKSRYCDLRFLRDRLDRAVEERIRSGRFGRSASGESS